MEQKAESIVFENFLKMVNKYPNRKWDWYEISDNKNFIFNQIFLRVHNVDRLLSTSPFWVLELALQRHTIHIGV